MIAIRNLYWTERMAAFIVEGIKLANTLCGGLGAAPGGVRAASPEVRDRFPPYRKRRMNSVWRSDR